MEINEPAVLARIPRPQTEGGRTFVSQVYGLSNGLKRRRQELCAAVDGDSINIYEVNQGRNLSSCSIPPDSTLLCSPYSLRSKSHSGKKIRSTYFATSRRGQNSLSVFEEELNGNARNSTSRCLATDDTSSPIVQLEVLPYSDAHLLLAIKDNGHFEIYNTTHVRKSHGKLYGLADEARLVTVLWLSSAQALKSILRSRPDVAAVAGSGSSFIVGVFGTSSDKSTGNITDIGLGVWQLSQTDLNSSSELSLDLILQHKLSISSPLVQRDREPIVFTAKETRLNIRTPSKLVVFDITKAIPTKVQETLPVVTDHVSSISISDALIMSSTPTAIFMHNTQLQTLQARLDLASNSLKRKRNATAGGSTIFLAYFTALNRIIASRRGQLIAIDLSIRSSDTISTAMKQTSLLANNIGRGAIPQDRVAPFADASISRSNAHKDQIEQWHLTLKQLENCIQDRDHAKFEEMALEHAIGKYSKLPTEAHIISNYKADYVISKIFEPEQEADETTHTNFGKVKSAFPTPKLLDALASKGLLTPERVGKVIRAHFRSNYEPVPYGNISQILIEADRSLDLLRAVLQKSPYVAYQELCAAILLLLRLALEKSSAISSLSRTDLMASISDPASSSNTISALSKATEIIPLKITDSLCIAVERLAETAQTVLSKHLHNTFSQGEIIALIQFLRQQLFRGGYTRSLQTQTLLSPPQSDNGSDVGQNPKHGAEVTIAAISAVLSSCVDAIGPVGVLGFGDDEEFVQTLIPELSSEISKAAEALQDATYLEGILRETLRFAESMSQGQVSATVRENGSGVSQARPGAIVTVYSEPATDSNIVQSSSALPLSLRAEGKISSTKVRKGDGKKTRRSEREMGMHQDRLRGPYAFERLVL